MQDAAETKTSAQVSALPAATSIPDEGRFVPGTVIAGRYRIISLLGRGGMGEVYRATDLTLGQPVALKFLPDTGAGFERMLERFQNEVRVARQVSHPNVCRVYDLGEFDGMPYMSMEYIDGEDLAGLLSRIGRLPADKALDIARKICAGLAAAHDKGVIHRDLKPANIMLDKRGNAVIMDFGLAAVASELRGPESKSGSPAYQAPEQLRGEEVTSKSDIYALGLVLYELFTGKRAYDAKSIADLIHIQEEADFVSMTSIAAEVDPSVEKAIRKCLSPAPLQRPASALSVSAMLPGGDPLAAALAAGETPSPELVAAAGRNEGWPLKYSAPMALALLVFFIALPWIRHNRERHSFVPMELPPEALAAKVREFATSFGYPQTPADRHFEMTYVWQLGSAAEKAARGRPDPPLELKNWYGAESPFQLFYRESPAPMVTWSGGISLEEPAPVTSGMIAASISSSGALRNFNAVPSQVDAGTTPAPQPVDSALIARAVGIDISRWEPVQPKFTPLYAFDWQQAWKGKHPILDLEMQVEAAAWHGKLTHLQVVWPWTKPGRMPEMQKRSAAQMGSGLAVRAGNVVVFLFSLFMAIRNLRAGRGDVKGAVRVAALMLALLSFQSLIVIHWVLDPEIYRTVVVRLSYDLVQAGLLCLTYLALEPAVRARWPQVLVAWSRLLRGQGSSPLVATNVLQGIFVASIIDAGVLVMAASTAAQGRLTNSTYPSGGMTARIFAADLAGLATNGIDLGFLLIFAIFLLRLVLRKDWLASIAMAGVMVLRNSDFWNGGSIGELAFDMVAFTMVAFVLLRLGLVATVVAITFIDFFLHIPGPQDLTKWYEWTVIAYPLVALLLVGWAFWRASGAEAMRIQPSDAT